MRKGIFVALPLTVIAAVYSLYLVNDKCMNTPKSSSLLLENIEALAANEDGADDGEVEGGITYCVGVGSLDCPLTHDKVKYVVMGHSL